MDLLKEYKACIENVIIIASIILLIFIYFRNKKRPDKGDSYNNSIDGSGSASTYDSCDFSGGDGGS